MDSTEKIETAPAATDKKPAKAKPAPQMTFEEEYAALVRKEAAELAAIKVKAADGLMKKGLCEEDVILPPAATELEKFSNLLRAGGAQKAVIVTGGIMPDATSWLQDFLDRGFVAVPRAGHIALY
ncbi:MAG: hypothetical protein AAB692_00015 [Patescibacteria group bacterium]